MPTILLKKSDTASSVPSTANLTNLAGGAEVAVNTADKRLFTMNSSSAVVELGTNPSSLTVVTGANLATTSGNVGIGTASPATKLQVYGDVNSSVLVRVTNNNAGASASSLFSFGNNADGNVGYVGCVSSAASVANGVYLANRISGPLLLNTNDTERMRIDSSGNVGIGTTTTTLSGTAFKAAISNSGFGIFGLNNSNNTNQSWGLFIGDSGAGTAGRFHLCQIVNGSGSGIAGGPAVPIISADVPTTANTTSRILIAADGVVSDQYGKIRAIPRTGSAKTSTYTLTVSDVGQFVELGTGGGIDVPNGVFSTGDVVSVFNNTTGNRTISLTITTAYIAGTDADKASVTLATRGVATVLFISNSVCVVSGNVT